MRVFVRLGLPDGRLVDLGPGDIIGRLDSAALRLDDPRVSEAHALVSLRGTELRLLALRGRLFVDARTFTDVKLTPGLVVQLAPDLALVVVVIGLPPAVTAIEGDGLPRLILPPVASLRAAVPELIPSFDPEADALLWTSGEAYQLRRPGLPDVVAEPGFEFTARGRHFRIVSVTLDQAAAKNTERDDSLDAPLVLVARYDTVHVHRGSTSFAISGVPARLLSELAISGVPVDWLVLARELWPAEHDLASLRQNLDRGLARLRQKLRAGSVRTDLVRADGAGRIELFLGARDIVQDMT